VILVLATGHRGSGFLEPENTIRAIRRTIELGVDQVEIDVQLTKDRKIVAIHDNTIDRTTNGHGLVYAYTLEELKRFDAGKGERIPTLQEVIETINGKIVLQIELKEPETVNPVIKAVEDNNIIEEVIIISFWHKAIKLVKEINPRVETGILFACSPIYPVQLAINAKADALHPNINFIDSDLVEEAHRSGLKVRVWNADDARQIKRMIALKVDAIVSNRPDLLIKMLKH
jgi:glycerophosphoryl diester phosphodiesterase